jgi:hypothetical protein
MGAQPVRRSRIQSQRGAEESADAGNGGVAEKIPARSGWAASVPGSAVITDWTVTRYSSWR